MTDVNLNFENHSNDENNSQVIIFKKVVDKAKYEICKKVSFNKLEMHLPDLDLSDLEGSLKNNKFRFYKLIIYSFCKGVKYKISTPKLETEGMFPAEIRIEDLGYNEFRIEIITPESSLISVIHSFELDVLNTEGDKIINVVDSQHSNQD